MRLKLEFQEKKLDQLFLTVSQMTDDETKALMSKFLCVRASGFIESSLKNLINEYTSKSVPKPIENFVNTKIKNITNLKYDRLAEVLGSFNEKWKEDFCNQISDEQKAALNSLVSNRNNIAHGENDVISYELMKNYYRNTKEVVDILKKIVKK
jgi:Mg/Co/Ni transporter MgtE